MKPLEVAEPFGREHLDFFIDDSILYHIFHPRTKRLDQIFPVVKQL